ncbi:MAG: PEP/pyruvate-binding domain-containing protein [Kiritimatiellia bacterium]
MPAEKSPVWRKAHEELCRIMAKLEKHYKYPQDVEFTVEQGKLWMLQTRNAKRTGLAGIRWAVKWPPASMSSPASRCQSC